jgi:hypothetical protein
LLKGGGNVLIADIGIRPEDEDLVKEYSNSPRAIFQKTDVTSWKQLEAIMQAAQDNCTHCEHRRRTSLLVPMYHASKYFCN